MAAIPPTNRTSLEKLPIAVSVPVGALVPHEPIHRRVDFVVWMFAQPASLWEVCGWAFAIWSDRFLKVVQ